MKKITLFLATLIISTSIARDGALDTTFGTDGLLTINFSGTDVSHAVLVQPDNKIVSTGSSGNTIAIARNKADGKTDTSFGPQQTGKLSSGFVRLGYVLTDFSGSGSDDQAQAAAIQSDGKVIAAGYTGTYPYDFALARYNTDGSLDTTFGTNGKVTTDISGASDDYISAIAIQPDGKIVVAGESDSGTVVNYNFALARYNPDGSLDTTFGSGGKVTTDFGTSDEAYAVALQADGKIVVAGYSNASDPNRDFALARYNVDGSLDPTFGTSGKVLTDFSGSGSRDEAYAVAIQSDGKIVAAGYSNASDISGDFALARYNSDGSLDNTFGTNGTVTTNFNFSDSAYAVAIQSDGKIVAVGVGDNTKFALARYNTDGSLDTTFGGDGKVTTNFGSNPRARAVAIQSDGKIVAAGYTAVALNRDFALARYNPDGSLDTTFGSGGKVTTDFSGSGSTDGAYAIAIQAEGKIVAAGYSNASGTNDFALARYTTDGSLDTSYGPPNTAIATTVYAHLLDINGSITVAGSAGGDFALARFLYNGISDQTFNAGGVVTTDMGGTDAIYALAKSMGSKIIAAGTTGTDFALTRYQTDGELDTSFNGTGKVTTDFSSTDTAYAVLVQPDQKVIAVGSSGNDFALARYTKDGQLDSSFGSGGKVITDLGGTDYAYAAALHPNGSLIAAGTSDNNFALVRYVSDGSLDTTFGSNGIVTTDLGSTDVIRAVAFQPDGKIVAAGYSGGDFALARYTQDGELDISFGTNGIIITDALGSDQIFSLAIQPDGNIVISGTDGGNFILARYLIPSIIISPLARDLRAKFSLLQ